MFEDSIFESAGRIHTRSHEWMVAAFAFNASILLAFVMIPLICPPALPPQVTSFLTQVFLPPKPQLPQQQPTQAPRPSTEMQNGAFLVPSRIPTHIYVPSEPEPLSNPGSDIWASISADPAGVPFGKPGGAAVRLENKAPIRISTTVEAGLLIQKTMPVYPPIARATRVSGTVTIAAIISKSGTIENLRVTGGPAILQQAALDAVKTWRYRPYLLDGQPVEVETTISVIFTLDR
jgi:protein TonB